MKNSAINRFIHDLIDTPIDEIANDYKAWCKWVDMEYEVSLKKQLEWYTWACNKALDKDIRKQYLETLRDIKREIEYVRKGDTHGKRAMVYSIRKDTKEDRNTRNSDHKPSNTVKDALRSSQRRVYSIGRQNKPS